MTRGTPAWQAFSNAAAPAQLAARGEDEADNVEDWPPFSLPSSELASRPNLRYFQVIYGVLANSL